jgi:DNA-binding MltR family transcriptional regulator
MKLNISPIKEALEDYVCQQIKRGMIPIAFSINPLLGAAIVAKEVYDDINAFLAFKEKLEKVIG